MYLMVLNRMYARMREAKGKRADVVDESMLPMKQTTDSKWLEENHELAQTGTLADDNGLNDVPDLMNEDFIYVY